MNETQKKQVTEAHGRLAGWLAGLGVPANWAKVGAGIIIGAAIGALATCQQACEGVAPEHVQQVQAAHELYHLVSGKKCILSEK